MGIVRGPIVTVPGQPTIVDGFASPVPIAAAEVTILNVEPG
ncbi:unnamed protein product, partial [marine sediment metagenome]